MIARCLLVTSVDAIEAGECELPAPGPGEVLIETSYSGISPGTELRALAGKQDGMPQYPFIPGYSLSGVVVETGPGCALPIGARVHTSGTRHASVNRLWGGHISHAVRAEREVYRIPDNVDLRDAALTRLLAIAYHGVRLSHPAAHETVAVVGLGPIGQLSARLHGVSGAQVVAADLSPERVDRARAAGVEAFVLEGDLVEGFQRYFPTGADVVADSTGAKSVLPQSIELAKIPAWGDGPLAPSRFLIQGSYPGDIMLPYNVAFLREAQILFPRDCQPGDIEAVLDLLHRERLKVADLRETVRRPEEAPETYAELKSAKSGMLTAIFDWKA
jgi:hypothetical protein